MTGNVSIIVLLLLYISNCTDLGENRKFTKCQQVDRPWTTPFIVKVLHFVTAFAPYYWEWASKAYIQPVFETIWNYKENLENIVSTNMHSDGIWNDSELQRKMKTMSLKHAFWHYLKRFGTAEKMLKTMSLKHAFWSMVLEIIWNCRENKWIMKTRMTSLTDLDWVMLDHNSQPYMARGKTIDDTPEIV